MNRAMASAIANDSRHFDTIVIGAGISGLACASRLYHHQHFRGKNRLLVIEARDRIGGRIGAIDVKGCRLDTGANWIHGIGTSEEPNPLMNILPHKRYRQLSGTVVFGVRDDDNAHEADDENSEDWVKVAMPSSQIASLSNAKRKDEVLSPDVAGPLTSSLWETIGELHEIASTTSPATAKHTCVLEALIKTESLRQAFNDIPKEYHSTLSALPQFIEVMEAAPLTAQSAEHPEGASGMSLLEYAIDDFDGDQVFLQDGYIAIIEELAKELEQSDLITKDTKVESIDWSKNPIRVQTSKGEFTATDVICTLPLGVLKHSEKQSESRSLQHLFQPALPIAKRKAVTNLGFGTLDKIFPVYSRPWWNEEPFLSIIKKGLVQRPFDGTSPDEEAANASAQLPDSFLGFTPELPGLAIYPDGSTSTGPQRLSVMNLYALTGFPALSIFVSCSTARQVEAMPDPEIQSMIHRAFTKWFGHEPPQPEALYVTRWAQDEFSRGSYSHMITGLSETRHREEFQNPLVVKGGDPSSATLRFAGEHTSRNHFATAHGALISGWREADAVLANVAA